MCFRYRTEEEADELHRRLVASLHANSRIFVTATYLNDRFWLRPSPGIFRTHAEHIDEFLEILKDFIAEL